MLGAPTSTIVHRLTGTLPTWPNKTSDELADSAWIVSPAELAKDGTANTVDSATVIIAAKAVVPDRARVMFISAASMMSQRVNR